VDIDKNLNQLKQMIFSKRNLHQYSVKKIQGNPMNSKKLIRVLIRNPWPNAVDNEGKHDGSYNIFGTVISVSRKKGIDTVIFRELKDHLLVMEAFQHRTCKEKNFYNWFQAGIDEHPESPFFKFLNKPAPPPYLDALVESVVQDYSLKHSELKIKKKENKAGDKANRNPKSDEDSKTSEQPSNQKEKQSNGSSNERVSKK
jgi:hypothetical protein